MPLPLGGKCPEIPIGSHRYTSLLDADAGMVGRMDARSTVQRLLLSRVRTFISANVWRNVICTLLRNQRS